MELVLELLPLDGTHILALSKCICQWQHHDQHAAVLELMSSNNATLSIMLPKTVLSIAAAGSCTRVRPCTECSTQLSLSVMD